MTPTATADPLLIAIDDPLLHPEATHAAAATGRPLIDAAGADALRRHYTRAHAVFLDAHYAPVVEDHPRRDGVFLLGTDVGDVNALASRSPHVAGSFVLPHQAGELLRAVGALGAAAAPQPRGGEAVIAVIGAAGGVGASTVGASISRVAGAQREPTIVDVHRYSGGLDLLLGIEGEIGARWGEIVLGDGQVMRDDVRRALPATSDGIAVLTHARTSISDPHVVDRAELGRVVTALSGAGVTVVDTPAHLVPERCELAVVVVPAEVRGTAAAARIVAECAAAATPAALVLRHRGWSSLSAAEVETAVKSRVIAEVGEVPRLRRAVEVSGLPHSLPRPLVRAARAVLAEVGL